MASNATSGGEVSTPSKPPSASTFSFNAPLTTASSSSTPPSPLKHRRVSLALPSSPRVVHGWNFRDDTGIDSHVAESTAPYASSPLAGEKKGKIRKIANSGDSDDATTSMHQQEKKQRKKWTPDETQMLVDGCNKHGVGNWKMILRDPTLKFDNRSPVDLKDRFRTYFPDAYKQHYPNARTHLSSKVRSTLPDGTSLFEKTRSKRRRPFTEEEDRALKEGYEKHGTVWATIVKDYPVFQEQNRRSTDLRDRFRNAFPELYQLAGYKPRNASKKKLNGEEPKTRMKRAAMDDQLATMSTGGPVRSRRRAHTSQGLLRGGTKSVPQSTACSEDEDSSGGEDECEFSSAFKPSPTPVFVDNISTVSLRAKITHNSFRQTDTFALDDDDEMEMVTLDPLSEPLVIPDFLPDHTNSYAWSSGINTPTHSNPAWSTAAGSPTSSHLSADYLMNNSTQSSPFLHRHSDSMNLNSLGSGSNNNMGMIGKSAWGTQDWFSPNPRLDPNSNGAMSSYIDQTSPASPFSFHHLNHGVLDRYDLFPTSMPHDFSSEVGVGDTHSTFSDEIFQPNGFRGFTHHSSYAGDLIFGARTYQPHQQSFYPSGEGNSFGFGLGLSGMSLSQNPGIHPMQLHTPSLLPGIDEIGLTGITLEDEVGAAPAADPLGIPLPPDVMEGDLLREEVPVIVPSSAQTVPSHQQSQRSQQRQMHQQKQQDEPQEPLMMSDRFSMDDLVDLSNESHMTPPATPLTHPRPLRRSSGSMLHHYPAGGAMHARSISVPPSEFRTSISTPPVNDFDREQRIFAHGSTQTQSSVNAQREDRRGQEVMTLNQDDVVDDDIHASDERPQTPTIASRHLTPLSRVMTTSLSSSSLSSLSSADSWRQSVPGIPSPDPYDLPFLDLHYYSHGGVTTGSNIHAGHFGFTSACAVDLMDTTTQTQARALDLARSPSATARSIKQVDGGFLLGIGKQHGGRTPTASPARFSQTSAMVQGGAETVSMFKQAVGVGRSQSHHRGQSAVNPQDLILRQDNNKRKRSSWDGRHV